MNLSKSNDKHLSKFSLCADTVNRGVASAFHLLGATGKNLFIYVLSTILYLALKNKSARRDRRSWRTRPRPPPLECLGDFCSWVKNNNGFQIYLQIYLVLFFFKFTRYKQI